MGREVKVGITVTAKTDAAQKALESLGVSGKNALSGIAGSAANTDIAMGKTKQAASATGAALGMLAGQIGGVGGEAAGAAGHLLSMGASLGSAGPVGIAVATAIVTAGALAGAYKLLTQASSEAREMSAKLAEVMRNNVAKALDDNAKKVDALKAKLADLNDESTPGAQLIDAMRRRENLLANIPQLLKEGSTEAANQALTVLEGLNKQIPLMEEAIQKTADRKVAENDLARAVKARGEAEDRANRQVDHNNAKVEKNNKAAVRAIEDRNNKQGRLLDDFIARRAKQIDFEAELFEAGESKKTQAQEKAQAERVMIAGVVSNTLQSLSTSIMDAAMADNSKMTQKEKELAVTRIAVNTAVALASAIAAGAAVAWPANIAAIASGVAAVGAAVAQIASFADGGFVSGGIQGRDSVPARLMPGEYVMSRGEVDGFSTMLQRFGASQGAVQGLMPMVTGGTTNHNASNVTIVNQMAYPDEVTATRMTRKQAAVTKRMTKRGTLVG